ncbi:unnamed protein product [Echinostoma caproni]|uniref:Alpha-galactosidase n=1 Tax=Echinostoma caproni TaxID=27848 RepID=A0A183A286_9TREM|nr:unnamed protein product [Echinostoma caproni]
MDAANSPKDKMPRGFAEFAQNLNDTGRSILFSCGYPAYIDWQNDYSAIDWEALKRNCNMWRLTSDLDDDWERIRTVINLYAENGEQLRAINGPGHWNDLDVLALGNFALSRDQERVQMGLWCMFSVPLMLSTDLTSINSESAALIKNKILIGINQDQSGNQAKFLGRKGSVMVSVNKCLLCASVVKT